MLASEISEIINGPTGDSDSDLWEFWKERVSSTWHFSGTAGMGREGGEGVVCDGAGRVWGVRGLRVVDMSLAPTVPCNHVQATAYLIGETIAEKMGEEYGFV